MLAARATRSWLGMRPCWLGPHKWLRKQYGVSLLNYGYEASTIKYGGFENSTICGFETTYTIFRKRSRESVLLLSGMNSIVDVSCRAVFVVCYFLVRLEIEIRQAPNEQNILRKLVARLPKSCLVAKILPKSCLIAYACINSYIQKFQGWRNILSDCRNLASLPKSCLIA